MRDTALILCQIIKCEFYGYRSCIIIWGEKAVDINLTNITFRYFVINHYSVYRPINLP